jgi:hypothetical protein
MDAQAGWHDLVGGGPARTGYAYGSGIFTVPMPCGLGWGHTGSTIGYQANV